MEQYKKGGKVKKRGNVTQTVNVYVTKRQGNKRASAPKAPLYAQGQPVAYPEPRLPKQLETVARNQEDIKLGLITQAMQMQQLFSRINQPITPGLPFERQSVPAFGYHTTPHGVGTNFNPERDLESALLRSTASQRKPDYPNGFSDVIHDYNTANLAQHAEHGSFVASETPDEYKVTRVRPPSPTHSEVGPGYNPFFQQLTDQPTSTALPVSVPFQPAHEPVPQPYAVARQYPSGTLNWSEWGKVNKIYDKSRKYGSATENRPERQQYFEDKRLEYNAYLDRKASEYEATRIPGPAPQPQPVASPPAKQPYIIERNRNGAIMKIQRNMMPIVEEGKE